MAEKEEYPSRPTRCGSWGSFTSDLTWVVVVVSAASFRYDDGKKLTGIGTRASKSRLTTLFSARELLLEFPFDVCERKTRRGLLLLFERSGGKRALVYAS